MNEGAIIRTVVIDDEPWALKLISDYVLRCPYTELTASYTNVHNALTELDRNGVDLYLLDVEMPDISGLNFLNICRPNCSVIMVSAFPEYAHHGYRHKVFDYLLKPVTYERFLETIDLLRIESQKKITVDSNETVFIKTENKLQQLAVNDILFAEALRDYIAIHFQGGKVLTLESLSSLEKRLPQTKFVRIHKSYIISLRHITFIKKNAVTIKERTFPIGDTYKRQLMTFITN